LRRLGFSIGRRGEKLDHPVGVGIGERFKKNGVDDGKDRSVDADPECKCGDGGEAKGGTLG
jgi:hypothetical protein